MRPIDIEISEHELARACRQLGVAPPRIAFSYEAKRADDDRWQSPIWGDYQHHSRTITVYVGWFEVGKIASKNKLATLEKQIRETLLHELRHHHQFSTWDQTLIHTDVRDNPYHARKIEQDARAWARRTLNHFPKLVRVCALVDASAAGFAS